MVCKGKISIIVPIYNVEKYLVECIESIRGQTYSNLEIILVDDGSKDRCIEICDYYGRIDSRIKVIHKENGGLSSARNAGIKIMTGEFVGFVDSDDYIAKDMYECMHDALISTNSQIAICEKTTNEKKIQLGQGRIFCYSKEQALQNMILGMPFGSHACDKLFSRVLFQENIFFPEGKTYEDLYTIYKYFDLAKNIVFCKRKKYYYRSNLESITLSKYSSKNLDMIYANKEIGKYFEEKYPELVKYQKMALVRCSVAILRKMIESDTEDYETELFLVKILKQNSNDYWRSPYKLLNKAFMYVCMCNYALAKKLYKGLKRRG